MDTVGIILLHVILLPIPIVKHRGLSQWCPHTLRMTDHHWQAIWVNRHYFEKWWEEPQESSDWWVISPNTPDYFDVPFLAFALFLMPCAGSGPPYFLPRIFLPRNLTFLPPMVYESPLSRALRPWLLHDANWLAPSWSSGTLLLHSFSGALASMISAILIVLFIVLYLAKNLAQECGLRAWENCGSIVTICSETLDKWGFSVIIYTVTKALTGVTYAK